MLGKKLLTLACVVGILAFGACFGPGYKPPSPPSLRTLSGVRTIHVTVSNQSPSRHLEPAPLAQAIVSEINSRTRQTGLRAVAQGESAPPDGFLAVVILDESGAVKSRTNKLDPVPWRFVIKISATLTGSERNVLWSDPGTFYTDARALPKGSENSPIPGWDAPRLQDDLDRSLSSKFIEKMLYLK